MWLCVQCRMWKADFMSVGTVPGKGCVECLVCGEDVKTAGKYSAQRQTMYLWGHSAPEVHQSKHRGIV